MIVTVASFKGGQAKTTSAVHLAAFLQEDKPTLLVDGDPNRSATGWARRKRLPSRSLMSGKLHGMPVNTSIS